MARPSHDQNAMLLSIQSRIADFPHDLAALLATPLSAWPRELEERDWMWTGAKTRKTMERKHQHHRGKRRLTTFSLDCLMPYAKVRQGGELKLVHRVLYRLAHKAEWRPTIKLTKPHWCNFTDCVNPCHWEPRRTSRCRAERVALPPVTREQEEQELKAELEYAVELGITSLDALLERFNMVPPEDVIKIIDRTPWLTQRVKR